MQKGIITMKNPPAIVSASSVVGSKEHDGPIGDCFDLHDKENKFGKETWEKSECEMQRLAFNLAMSKIKMRETDIDAVFAGDLLNQCIGSAYGLLDFDIPYFGLYGACSTAAEGIVLSSLLISGGTYECCAAVASSHNCSAERQYRFPLEYGGQRTPTAQWTVTGAGAFILQKNGTRGVHVTEVLPGIVIEKGIKDANNMGAAMAPAAVGTLLRYFGESGKSPTDFDYIVTGDLGYEGSEILKDMMRASGTDISGVHLDCGELIFDGEKQDTHAGGSGCGCSAVVLASYLLPKLQKGEIKDILFMGTGAMMSPASIQQGESIPAIAHLAHISSAN